MSFLRSTYHLFPIHRRENIFKLERMKNIHLNMTLKSFPKLYISNFLNKKVAYMLREESPKQVATQGGFYSHKKLWFSSSIGGKLSNCNNTGTICLTLLPEITSIFLKNRINEIEQKPFYIYALPLIGNFIFLGGTWRQVASPKILPLTSFWRCRKVLGIDNDNVLLGPIVGQGEDHLVIPGERYDLYLGNYLKMPPAIGIAEDYPEIYNIQDTTLTEQFQNMVAAHYKNINHNQLTNKFNM